MPIGTPAGKRFSLDDIIADEVQKAIAAKAIPSNGGGFGLESLGIKNLGDITSLLKEINSLAQTFSGNRNSGVHKPIRQIDGSQVKISKDESAPNPVIESTPSSPMDIGRLVDNFIQYMPLFIQTYGDLRLSEVEPLLKEHRDEIIVALQAVL